MRARFTLAAVAAAAFAPPVNAQTAARMTIPHAFKGAYSPGSNLLPLGRTKALIQTWYRGDNLPTPSIVTAIGWRVDERTSAAGYTARLEVVVDNSTKTFQTLAKPFKGNLGSKPTTLVKLKNIKLPNQTLPSNPDQPAAWFPADTPFVFAGPHLLVQVDVQTSTAPTSNRYNVDAHRANSNLVSGKSCGGRIGSRYAGGQYVATVTGAQPNTPVSFLLGVENQRFAGQPLPLDLGQIGLTGCFLGIDPLIVLPRTANGAGIATLSVATPLPPATAALFAQGVHQAANNKLATTDVASSLLGTRGYVVYLYNWTVFGPNAQYGPYTTDRGAVILLR